MAKDFSKLRGLIVEKYGSQTAFCEATGKTLDWLSRRLNGRVEFGSDDIIEVVNALEISPQDISLYFFTPKVR